MLYQEFHRGRLIVSVQQAQRHLAFVFLLPPAIRILFEAFLLLSKTQPLAIFWVHLPTAVFLSILPPSFQALFFSWLFYSQSFSQIQDQFKSLLSGLLFPVPEITFFNSNYLLTLSYSAFCFGSDRITFAWKTLFDSASLPPPYGVATVTTFSYCLFTSSGVQSRVRLSVV